MLRGSSLAGTSAAFMVGGNRYGSTFCVQQPENKLSGAENRFFTDVEWELTDFVQEQLHIWLSTLSCCCKQRQGRLLEIKASGSETSMQANTRCLILCTVLGFQYNGGCQYHRSCQKASKSCLWPLSGTLWKAVNLQPGQVANADQMLAYHNIPLAWH